MRNLKRALSLALASVMLVGMMVVGTSAGYVDVNDDAHNTEAIEVLQAVGVMKGDENGNFNPDALLTRQEMAVVLSNLMDYRVSSYAGTAPFGDVADWAEPYVAACYTNELVAGMGGTYFGATENLTTAQAALMLMKVLGYFQYASDFGADWELATVKQANKIELFDDVDAGVKEYITRNELAQLVLNALEAGTVEADNDTIKVEADNVKVEAGSVKYNWLTSGKPYAQAIEKTLVTGTPDASGNTQGSIIQLGEKLYNGNLKKDDASVATGFNAPATKWTYKSEVIGTYADDYDLIYTGAVKSTKLYNDLGEDAAEDYNYNVYLNGDEALGTKKVNNVESAYESADFKADVVKDNNADLKNTGRGTTTYVYIDDDNSKITVCIVETWIAEIIEEDKGTITLDDNSLEFDVEGYEEDQYVIYTKSYKSNTDKWTVESVIGEATYVEGTVDQVKDVDTVIIEGKSYKYNTTVAANDKIGIDSYDQIVGFYLDAQGHIGLVDSAVESGDYAYVVSVGKEGDKYNSNDNTDFTAYAKLVLVDGTVVKVEIDEDDYAEKNGKDDYTDTYNKFFNQIVSYVVNEDGTYSLNPKKAVETVASVKVDKGTAYISGLGVTADNNTDYLLAEDIDDDEYTAYKGYKNVSDIEGTKIPAAAIIGKNGLAKFVFIGEGAKTKTSVEDMVFVIGRTNEKEIKSSVGNYYEYKAIVNGETTTIKVKDTANNLVKGACSYDKQVLVYSGITVNSKGLVTDLETWVDDTTNEVYAHSFKGSKRLNTSTGLVGFGYNGSDYTSWYGVDDDVIVAYYEDSGNTLSAVAGIDSLKTDVDDGMTVITEEGNVIAIIGYINQYK